jgi:glycosyltransferase involved in cell wall biosynthesis
MRCLANPRPPRISFSLLAAGVAGLAFVSPGAAIPQAPTLSTVKILHISTSDGGGAGKAALRLHEGLLLGGVDSKMLVERPQAGAPGVFHYREPRSLLRRIQKRYRVHKINSDLQRYRRIRPDIRTAFSDDRGTINVQDHPMFDDADIIHLHWIAYFVDGPNFFSSIKGKPVVWTLHDMNPFTGGCHYAGDCDKYKSQCGACPQLGSTHDPDLAANIWGRKKRAYKAHNIHVVTPSLWLANCARQSMLLGRMPVSIIPYGIPTDIFRKYDQGFCRALLGLPQHKTIILFGANNVMDERKGAQYLKEALQLLSKRMNVCQVVVAIFGSKFDPMHQSFGIATHVLGNIKDERLLAACYNAADVFVIPSLEDNLPNTVLESMACGTPVIAFKTGGIPEMVSHLQTGLLTKPKDAHALAEQLQWMVEHPHERARMGVNGRDVVCKEYTSAIQASRYVSLYASLGSCADPSSGKDLISINRLNAI